MKKQLILTVLALGVSAVTTFAQGYVTFATTGKNFIYDNFTTPNTSVVSSGTADVAFLIGTGTPLIEQFYGNNNGNPTGTLTFGTYGNPWNDILTDPNFHLATNMATSVRCVVLDNTSSLAKGGISYNGGSSFQALLQAGGTWQVYAIAWNAAGPAGNNPYLAATDGEAVGWSDVFNYSSPTSTGTAPSSFNASGMVAFGVTPVPEPVTFALVGLGGLSLLLFRRRKV